MNNITYDARVVKTVRNLKTVTGKKNDEARHDSDNTSSKITCSSENSKEDSNIISEIVKSKNTASQNTPDSIHN